MGFLLGRTPSLPPAFTGLQISTSSATMPIAIAYGTPLLPGNLISAQNFVQVGNNKKTTGKGKGGSAARSYAVDVILALGEGVVTEPGSNEANFVRVNGLYYNGASIPVGTFTTATFYGGGVPQGPFSLYTGANPFMGTFPNGTPVAGSDGLPYTSVALWVATGVAAGNNAAIPQFEFLMPCKFAETCPLNRDPVYGFEDADIALVFYDILTSPVYGPGFPAAYIDPSIFSGPNAITPMGDDAFQTYCQAAGFGFSAVLRSSEPMSSILDRWCKLLATAVVWTGSTLKFIPYWDTQTDSNPGYDPSASVLPKTFTPLTQPIFSLGDSDFLQGSGADDPVILTRSSPADTYNTVRVSFKDRANEYNTNVVEWKDENAVELSEPGSLIRVQDIQAGEEFSLLSYAQLSAQVIGQRNTSIRLHGKFKLGWKYAMLDPMDVLSITDVNLGLFNFPVRITSITEAEDCTLEVEVEEFPIGSASPPEFGTNASRQNTGTGINVGVVPAPSFPLIFDVPASLVSQATIGFAVHGSNGGVFDPNWGGCIINWSFDGGASYSPIGTVTSPAKMGPTTSSISSYSSANPNTGNTLGVDLRRSNGVLHSTSAVSAAAEQTRCVLKDASGTIEIISFQNITLTGPNQYNITHIWRGLDGSAGISHSSGIQFARFDSSVFQLPIDPSVVGVALMFKFQSFNIYGQALQPISSCTPYSFTP